MFFCKRNTKVGQLQTDTQRFQLIVLVKWIEPSHTGYALCIKMKLLSCKIWFFDLYFLYF